MKIKKFLNYVQSQPHQTKARIIMVAVIAGTLGSGALWLNGVKNTFTGIDTTNLLPTQGSVLSASSHVAIESFEEKGGKKYIYFKAINDSPDILNFSNAENIKLTVGEGTLVPEKILDRQGREFVRKVLTNTTNYGVLVFPEFTENMGEITFDQMFFEQSPANIFKEQIQIDLRLLNPVEELRS